MIKYSKIYEKVIRLIDQKISNKENLASRPLTSQNVEKHLGDTGLEAEYASHYRIGALSGIGSQQRALRQAGLDLGYEDFMRQSAFPQQQLGFFSNILRGIPVTPQRTVSTFQQQPGLFQQALGLGLGGLGLYKGFGGGR